ncbi:hypothetical protein M0R45_003037 [Rubus argutus]|uniref:Dynamin stalk domain-containing protein n=1 Tax=Rubus argutus TaxID=59490 RepID=A0AAW1YGV3_RUBAR
MIAARRREREYFANTPEYKHLAHRMGSEHLAKMLSKHLETVIKTKIPGIQSLINKTIHELESELSRLGKPIATDAGGKLYAIMEICRLFDGTYKEHLDGVYRPGGDKIYNVFDNQLPADLERERDATAVTRGREEASKNRRNQVEGDQRSLGSPRVLAMFGNFLKIVITIYGTYLKWKNNFHKL